MSREFELDVVGAGPRAIVVVNGELDVSTAPRLRGKLVGLVSEGTRDIVVDLSQTSYVDGAGVDVLVRALKLLSAHEGTLSVVCPQVHLLKLFELASLSDAFGVHATLEGERGPATTAPEV